MKKLFITLIVFFSINFYLSAQTSEIFCSAFKGIELINNAWTKWPTDWREYKSQGKSNLVFKITILGEGEYGLTQSRDGNIVSIFEVRYDRLLTEKIRKSWGNENVYCYREVPAEYNAVKIDPRDYICVQNTSLQSLANDPSSWQNQSTVIYLYLYSLNFAVAMK